MLVFKGCVLMVDPGQVAIGIIVMIVVVGALLFIFYSRTNAVEKTGYGALIMLSVVSLMIPIFWIIESNNESAAAAQQHVIAVQTGATLYAQYCYTCHGTKGQGNTAVNLNGNSTVNSLSDQQLLNVIEGGVINPSDPTKPLMPAYSDQFAGPLDTNDIQYIFQLVRSADPAYLQKNGFTGSAAVNGFTQVASDLQSSNPSGYATAVAQEASGQFGAPVDMTNKKAVTITIINSPSGASCQPACFSPANVKVKVGTTITWINKSSVAHTVTAIVGSNLGSPTPAPKIFDSGATTLIAPGKTFTYTVTTAAYNFNKNHELYYYCRIHPGMLGELTIVQ
jgi:plastocyanin/mono/diheme cytochrome c family protein